MSFPSAAEIAEMPTEDLAMHVLRLIAGGVDPNGYGMQRGSFLGSFDPAAQIKVTQAWDWLQREGLAVQEPGQSVNFVIATDEGKAALGSISEFFAARNARHLLSDRLRPELSSARRHFDRGDYEAAVLAAYKVVEVTVRDAASYGPELFGTKLMSQAFDPQAGPLADPNTEPGEQAAMRNLFAGAYGVFRNSTSHREVDLNDPQEVSEIILLANLLLRIVASSRPNGSGAATA